MRRILRIVAVLLSALALCVGVYVAMAGRDIPPPDFSDLLVERIDVPPEENAFTYFAAATNVFVWPFARPSDDRLSQYLNGETSDLETMRDIVATNAAAIALLRQGAACRSYQAPEIDELDEAVPWMPKFYNMAQMLAIVTESRLRAGENGKATDSAVLLLRFGQLLQENPEPSILWRNGWTALAYGLARTRWVACDARTSSDDLLRLAEALHGVTPLDAGLLRSYRGEFWLMIRAIESVRQRGMASLFGDETDDANSLGRNRAPRRDRRAPSRFSLQPNRTKRMLAEQYRSAIRSAPLSFREQQRRQRPPLPPDDEAAHFFRPNDVGNRLVSTLSPPVMHNSKCRLESDLAGTRAIVALHRYHRDHACFPDALAELVPEYLDAVPHDPCDGEPLRYSREKGLVYSVGLNLVDDGGKPISKSVLRRLHPEVFWKTNDLVYEFRAKPEP